MSWSTPTSPNLADFLIFIANQMDIGPAYLPSNSPWPQYALNSALAQVNDTASAIDGLSYTIATYNCAAHLLLLITPDQPNQTFFRDKRQALGMLKMLPGVTQSSSDQGTSDTFAVPEQLRNLTFSDLDFMRTHYGRAYLGYCQAYGEVSGLS